MEQHGIMVEHTIELMGNYYSHNEPATTWERTTKEESVNEITQGFLNGKEGSVSSLLTDIWSILVTTLARAITIPMTLYKTEDGKITETTALINSGVTICCVDLHFAQRMKWPLEKLCHPLYACNANGTHNSEGMI